MQEERRKCSSRGRILILMNWRRGLLFAALNLLLSVPFIVWTEVQDTEEVRYRDAIKAEPAVQPRTNAADGNEIEFGRADLVFFDLCGGITDYPPPDQVVRSSNVPATVATQWRFTCPSSWSLSGMLLPGGWQPPTHASISAHWRVDVGFCILIAIQWFLVGSFPLTRPQQWWREPGALITLCTVLATAMVALPTASGLSRLPALVAGLVWLYWFGLLILKLLVNGWRLAFRKAAVTPVAEP